MVELQTYAVQIPQEIIQNWGWFLALGIGLLVLGVAAIARSFVATVATLLFFGWLLLFASGIEIVQAILVGHWAGFFHHLVAAVLFGAIGFLLVARPLVSAEALTLVIGLFFLTSGVFQLVGSLLIGFPGWIWQAVDGVITIILGALVLTQWPVSGLWVIGLLIGIDLVFYGAAWIALALGLRNAA